MLCFHHLQSPLELVQSIMCSVHHSLLMVLISSLPHLIGVNFSLLLGFWTCSFPGWRIIGDLDNRWYCTGLLKNASTFFPDTDEKHFSPAPAQTADHPILSCRKLKPDMFGLARKFLKLVRTPKAFAAVIDFADLPSDSEQSGDSDYIPSCEPESLN